MLSLMCDAQPASPVTVAGGICGCPRPVALTSRINIYSPDLTRRCFYLFRQLRSVRCPWGAVLTHWSAPLVISSPLRVSVPSMYWRLPRLPPMSRGLLDTPCGCLINSSSSPKSCSSPAPLDLLPPGVFPLWLGVIPAASFTPHTLSAQPLLSPWSSPPSSSTLAATVVS